MTAGVSGRAADPPVKSFATPRAFETWLSRSHGKAEGIWLVIAKKGSGIRSVTYAEAVEVVSLHPQAAGREAEPLTEAVERLERSR